MWPSAVLLAHHLTRNPSIVLGSDDGTPDGDILELGSGCGLAGLTAATLLQNSEGNEDRVIFTDYNPSVLKNLERNIELNDFAVDHQVLGLDWFDQQKQPEGDQGHVAKRGKENTWVDMSGTLHAQARLIIGADLMVCSNDAELVAGAIDNALMEGGKAIILGADAYTRFGVRNFPDECSSLGLSVEVTEDILESMEDNGSEQQLMAELELGGYNQRAATYGHDFTMFTIDKPITSA